MSWLSMRHAFVAVFVSVMASSGCQEPPVLPVPPAKEATAESEANTPEAAFTEIVEKFRRGVEDEPIGFVVRDNDAGRKTMMTGRNRVSYELLPPKNDGDPLKAVIKVRSESKYSMQRTTEGSKGDSSNEEADQPTNGQPAESDFQVFDSSIASTPDQSAKPASPSDNADSKAVVVGMADEKDERAYELVYENGRWKLVTELDPDTEGLIKLAFERALATQG